MQASRSAVAALVAALVGQGTVARAQVPPLSGGEHHIFTDAGLTTPGLVGSYVDANLRSYSPQDDWRETQVIAGSRVDEALDFQSTSWGKRAEVGLTGGSDENWDTFSVQWDGFVQVVTSDMRLATLSDDSSRMWIDLNGDDVFDSSGPEFIDNNWGSGQAATLGPPSAPLSPGVYRIRIQYEEGVGGNVMRLVSPIEPIVRAAYLIPSNRVPQPDGAEHFAQIVLQIHAWCCEYLERHGFDPQSFRYETEADGVTPWVHVVNVTETDDYLREDIWARVGQAATAAGVPLWTSGQVWLLVPETHLQNPDGSVVGGVALGASGGSGNNPGVAMVSSTLLSVAPAGLTDDTPYHGLTVPGIGPWPLVQDVSFPWFSGSTISSVVSSFMGATMHELMHGFGIAHDFRHDQNFHGNMMGNGLRGFRGAVHPDVYPLDDARMSRAAALSLNLSRYFTACEAPPAGTAANAAPHTGPPSARAEAPAVELWCDSDRLSPVVPVSGGGGGDTTSPVLTILTSGTVAPVDGRLEIQFEAQDAGGLALALLKRNGNTVGEMELSGTVIAATFSTPQHNPGALDSYSILVYDEHANRTSGSVEITALTGFNRAPIPSFRVYHSWSTVGAPVQLDAGASDDPDSTGPLVFEWDLDGDGTFDTPPTTTPTLTTTFDEAGAQLVSVRVTDPVKATSAPTPIAVRSGAFESAPCPGDTDGNGQVDVIDFLALLSAWGTDDALYDIAPDGGDGIVDTLDFLALLANWGPCG